MPRPIRATIHTAALTHNLAVARRHAGAARVWAVIKADAYGHGIERVLPALQAADGFALLDIAEALRVRRSGWRGPVLLLEGAFDATDLAVVIEADLTVTVHRAAQIDWLAQAPAQSCIDVYLKIDTGMHRLGFQMEHAADALRRLESLAAVRSVTVMTHLANADRHADQQLAREWLATLANLPGPDGKLRTRPISLANSAATLSAVTEPGADTWVRAGVMLYGGSPFADRRVAAFDLLPTMSLSSRLIAIQPVRAGDTVGYGSRYRATRDLRLGVVACGYGDGYPRHAPNGTPVWVDGVACPLAGRISMDMLTVDLSTAPQARVGSPVELWGRHVPIDAVAQQAGTIGYELMCALAPRVPVEVAE